MLNSGKYTVALYNNLRKNVSGLIASVPPPQVAEIFGEIRRLSPPPQNLGRPCPPNSPPVMPPFQRQRVSVVDIRLPERQPAEYMRLRSFWGHLKRTQRNCFTTLAVLTQYCCAFYGSYLHPHTSYISYETKTIWSSAAVFSTINVNVFMASLQSVYNKRHSCRSGTRSPGANSAFVLVPNKLATNYTVQPSCGPTCFTHTKGPWEGGNLPPRHISTSRWDRSKIPTATPHFRQRPFQRN